MLINVKVEDLKSKQNLLIKGKSWIFRVKIN